MAGDAAAECAEGRREDPLRVLLVNEGTYPFGFGGVSTWCDALIRSLPDVEFSLVSFCAQPGTPSAFELPANVVGHRAIPLWGVSDAKETARGKALRRLTKRAVADDPTVSAELVPLVRAFVRALFLGLDDAAELGHLVHRMYRFFVEHDMDRAVMSEPVWQAYVEEVRACLPIVCEELDRPEPAVTIQQLTTGFQWLYRWLFAVATPLPAVDVVHTATAGIATMVAVAAKLEHGAGFLMTEHGVYLRERYLAEAAAGQQFFLKLVAVRFARRMTEMTYALADQISPCCDFNQRWERRLGAGTGQLETIYYGVDEAQFFAGPPPGERPNTVVWVGRINPLKDVETLLAAAGIVVASRPDVRFLLYGSAPRGDEDYFARCMALYERLGLQDNVELCGYTSDAAAAFRSGDLVVLSSISEGFPFSTLEAMLSGRPVIATAVGGIPEQIAGCGRVVEPRNSEAMAKEILALLDDRDLCARLGVAARERAVGKFGANRCRSAHWVSYLRLSARCPGWMSTSAPAATATATATAHAGRGLPAPRLRLEPSAACSTAADRDALEALADDVTRVVGDPLDPLEVAAVIESVGINDDMAAQRFARPTTFDLGEDVLTVIRDRDRDRRLANSSATGVATTTAPTSAAHQVPVDHADPVPAGAGRRRVAALVSGWSHLDSARHPAWTLVPSVLLIATMSACRASGHWDRSGILAMAFGMTAGMVLSSGLGLGMAPRASKLISFASPASTRRFLAGTFGAGIVLAAVVVTQLAVLGTRVAPLGGGDAVIFEVSAIALAGAWLVAAALSLVQAGGWTGLGFTAGLATGAGVDRALAPVWTHHLAAGAAAGIAVVYAVMLAGLLAAVSRRASEGARDVPLPALGYLVAEGRPHFLYGSLSAFFFLSVHVLGWVAAARGHGDWLSRAGTLEVALFLPLPPAALGTGFAERGLRRFWQQAAELQRTITVRDEAAFRDGLRAVHRRERRSYLGIVAAMSVATLVLFEVLLRHGVLVDTFRYSGDRTLERLFVVALVGYGLLGWAQFEAMFPLSLARPGAATRVLLLASVVTVLASAGVVVAARYEFVVVALVLGAAVFAISASRAARRTLDRVTYLYVRAV